MAGSSMSATFSVIAKCYSNKDILLVEGTDFVMRIVIVCAQLKRNDHGTQAAKPSMDGGVA